MGVYVEANAIQRVQKRGIDAYVAISDEEQNVRRYDCRSPWERKLKVVRYERLVAMREKLSSDEGREIYAKRARTVKPVFRIIKAPLGFRQSLLPGLQKVRSEWNFVCLAYYMERLYNLASPLGGKEHVWKRAGHPRPSAPPILQIRIPRLGPRWRYHSWRKADRLLFSAIVTGIDA